MISDTDEAVSDTNATVADASLWQWDPGFRSTESNVTAISADVISSEVCNIDTTPPVITVTATPNTIWPPDHKMVDVLIDGSATDNESGVASTEITVTDEYGIYNMTVPGFGSTIQLEAWREGEDKDGRVYTITVTAKDNAGNESTATTQVTVPHDMGN
ncbi:MAG: hypothetical protein HY754_11310 [Nitrospirae bacterium]|nr:hypothetical protein [Nitrospirota bacterium]